MPKQSFTHSFYNVLVVNYCTILLLLSFIHNRPKKVDLLINIKLFETLFCYIFAIVTVLVFKLHSATKSDYLQFPEVLFQFENLIPKILTRYAS